MSDNILLLIVEREVYLSDMFQMLYFQESDVRRLIRGRSSIEHTTMKKNAPLYKIYIFLCTLIKFLLKVNNFEARFRF